MEIYTGYLQIYSYQGPMCDDITFQPIKIVSLSCMMQDRVYESYEVDGRDRLIFEKISGILFDTYISVQPEIYLKIMPLTKVVDLPKVNMVIENQYYSLPVSLEIKREPFQTQPKAIGWFGKF